MHNHPTPLATIRPSRRATLCAIIGTLEIATSNHAGATTPLEALKSSNPNLYALYQAYSQNHAQLADYAIMQGFQRPTENLATVLHEIIHIDSHAHRGYYIGGAYYAPYLSPNAWPTLNNSALLPSLSAADISSLGPIYTQYMPNAPKNTIANELDEINAYAQSIQLICANAPQEAAKHLQALTGHLALLDIYLGTLSASYAPQYHQLVNNRTSRGALETIVANAYTTLNQCYRQGATDSDPRGIPKTNTQAFAATAK